MSVDLARGKRLVRGRKDGTLRGVSTFSVEDTLVAGVFQSGVWVRLVWNGDVSGNTHFDADAASDSLGRFHVSAITQPGWYTVWVSTDGRATFQSSGRQFYAVGPLDDTGLIPESSVTGLTADLAARALDSTVVHKTDPILDSQLSRNDWTPADYGWLAWTFDPVNVQAGGTPISGAGVMHVARLHIRQPITVTNILLYLSVIGATLTFQQNWAFLYKGDSSRSLVSWTNEQSTNWSNVTGLKVMPLQSPQALAAGDYYVGLVVNGTTLPQFYRAALSNAINGQATVNRFATANTGITNVLPGSISLPVAQNTSIWFALS